MTEDADDWTRPADEHEGRPRGRADTGTTPTPGPDVETVLLREFPGREITDLAAPARGNRKRTVLATFADGNRVVVQVAPLPAVRTEAALTGLVGVRTDLPVARVRAVGDIDGRGYVVTDAVAGDDLHTRFADLSRDRQRTICGTFGRGLAELHDCCRFEGYGPVGFVGDWEAFVAGVRRGDAAVRPRSFGVAEPTGSPPGSTDLPGRTPAADWHEWVRTYADAGLRALPPAFDDLCPRLGATVRAEIAEGRVPGDPPSRLFPWDFRPGNAVVSDGRVTAILDWGEPLAADPALSVAKTEHLLVDWYVEPPDSVDLRRAFRTGYESIRPLPSVPDAYRLVAVVHSAVDSKGVVTRPRCPEPTGTDAVAFHRERLLALLNGEHEG
jgi:aminoglycoside phosphotransferase (APT) family kinase protein